MSALGQIMAWHLCALSVATLNLSSDGTDQEQIAG